MFDLTKDTKENVQIFFTKESIVMEETIKKALNIDCLVKFTKVQTTDKIEKKDFFARFNIDINGIELGLYISMDTKIASILSDLMLMGPGEDKDTLEPDDIDSLKELFSQNLGAFATAMKEEGYKVSFNGFSQTQPKDEPFFESEFEIIITNTIESSMHQYVSVDGFEKVLDNLKVEVLSSKNQSSLSPLFEIEDESNQTSTIETSKDNLNLLMDIELNARIRIGSKQMLLKDVVKLSEGTIIDLDKSVDEPMEILVNGKIIAKGIVVVVGGNFGIKITHVGTKEDRIKSLGG
ncbi:Flagellar motor switch protein FliN [Desulfurella amilsii]|uniref:Flagellar motor switch protein FliN n=1 Tax=Desulfurella amilsii TaxID=1562698 RepID=A0A1X4XXM2_9BACT|nr:flagellar motor switch protein FliN [Desulfurella amilsii]OSS42290.1 Flagellar motor switch protein FliN [Desulfurella amilsii]